MGKMRFKLSLVMPHAWFYKLREVGKQPRISHHPYSNNSCESQNKQNRKHISPVNHKANDIPFPTDTPKKTPISKSPLPPVAEDIAILSPLGPIEISVDNWPSIHSVAPGRVSTGTAASASMDDEYTEDDQFPGFSSAKPNRASSVTFDVRELERRLKNLGSEDRRKYYTSPLLSEAIPSPMVLDSNNQQDVNKITSSSTTTANNGYGYLQSASGMVNNIPRSPLKSIQSQGKPPLDPASFHHRISSNFEPQSLRHSSTSISSSDTGYDRGSSSMWDKDALSNMTSDGSDVEFGHSMKTTCRQSNRKPKNRSRSRSNSAYNSPMRNSDVVGAGMDLTEIQNVNDSASIDLGHGDLRWSLSKNYNSNGMNRSSPRASPVYYQPSRRSVDLSEAVTDALSSSMYSNRPQHNLIEYDEMMNQMSLVEYVDGNDNRSAFKGHHRKLSSPLEFSYSGCKERLLSGSRKSVDYHSDKAASESEMETMSNYTRFKLMQKGLIGHVQDNDKFGGVSPDRGGLFGKSPDRVALYAKGSSPKHGGYQKEQILIGPASSPIRGRLDVDQSLYSNPNRNQSEYNTKAAAVAATTNDPSWSKRTLNAVREKTKDPNFKQFSAENSDPATGTNSRVFDSFAMLKCSYDPKQDFKESMLEMILEKDLQSSHDLVELLQCYLTLNSEKYHDTIVKAFTEVWAEVFQQGT